MKRSTGKKRQKKNARRTAAASKPTGRHAQKAAAGAGELKFNFKPARGQILAHLEFLKQCKQTDVVAAAIDALTEIESHYQDGQVCSQMQLLAIKPA